MNKLISNKWSGEIISTSLEGWDIEVPSTKVIHPILPVHSVESSSGAVGPSTRVGEGPSEPIVSFRMRLMVSLTLTLPLTHTTTKRYWSKVPRLRRGLPWSSRVKLSFRVAMWVALRRNYLFEVTRLLECRHHACLRQQPVPRSTLRTVDMKVLAILLIPTEKSILLR